MQEFVLDLTSICVRSGALQLPSKMLSHFEVGVVKAAAGGGEVELTFTQPRTLSGLRQFFESQGLKANDRLRIEVDDAGGAARLKVVAERRERPKPSDARASSVVTHGRYSGPSQTPAASESADPSAMVRVVRKVRIEAQPTHSAQASESRFAADRGVNGKNSSALQDRRWSALAGDQAQTRLGAEARAADLEPLTSVRVVRRGQQSQAAAPASSAPVDESVTAPSHEPQWAPAARTRHTVPEVESEVRNPLSGLLPLAGRRNEQPSPSAEAPNPRRAPGHKLSRFGVRFWSERGTAQPLRNADDELISDAEVSEEEMMAEAPVAAAPPPQPVVEEAEVLVVQEPLLAAAPTESEPHAFDAFLGDAAAPSDTRPSAIWRRASRSAAPRQTSSSQAPGFMPPTMTEQPALEPVPVPVQRSQPTRPGDLSSQALARGEVRVAPLRGTVVETPETPEIPEAVEAKSQVPAPAQTLTVEDVIPRINQYLMRPETPAIVQTRTLADDLKLDLEIAELAMERLSEDRDRFNRIRPGAYMVRRASL